MSVARLMQQAAAGSAGAGPEPSGWTDPDLGNASYDSVSFSVSGQTTLPSGLFFKPDGTKLYSCGYSSDSVHEYNLSTAWDVSSAAFSQSFSVSTQDTSPQDLFFKDDGTTFYIVGNSGNSVYEYNLSTPWDISTAVYNNSFSVTSQETTPNGLWFKPDGTSLYVVGGASDSVHQYNLSTAWDITTSVFSSSFSVSAQNTYPESIFISPNGDVFFVLNPSANEVQQYSMSTAWDISTASYDAVSFSVVSQETNAKGMYFKSDGSKLYVVGATNDTIYQYSTA